MEGVSIFIDTHSPSGNSKYYRFEYEETYKIIAPLYSPQELIPKNVEFPFDISILVGLSLEERINYFVDLRLREEQEQICYNTVKSSDIIIASTSNLLEDILEQFRIRFINRDNYIISHRYSVFVKQYVQSREAHAYYETLKSFSDSENVFSENQTGFLEGNVFSISNEQEKVIGFFEVSSVDEKRVYFNYADLFPGDILPPYYINCDDFFAPVLSQENLVHDVIRSPLIDALNSGMQFYDVNENADPSLLLFGPFILVLEPCGDCTVLGENIVPDFWEE